MQIYNDESNKGHGLLWLLFVLKIKKKADPTAV